MKCYRKPQAFHHRPVVPPTDVKHCNICHGSPPHRWSTTHCTFLHNTTEGAQVVADEPARRDSHRPARRSGPKEMINALGCPVMLWQWTLSKTGGKTASLSQVSEYTWIKMAYPTTGRMNARIWIAKRPPFRMAFLA